MTTDTKLKEIIAAQEDIFVRRQPRSKRLARQARSHLAGGVTSSWQITVPQPVWLSHGRGSKVWDVDGNEYVDQHGGYGAALAGHDDRLGRRRPAGVPVTICGSPCTWMTCCWESSPQLTRASRAGESSGG